MKSYLLIGICALGCSEGKRVNITQSVGASGGTVETGDGTAVNIPAGALAAQANITIESVNLTPPSGVVQVGPAYDFGPEGSTFSTAVTITLPFAPDRIPTGKSAADVRIYTAPRGSSAFSIVTTAIEASVLAKTSTTHFTTYFPGVASTTTTVVDMAGATGPNGCTPTCQTTDGCTCSGTCNGKKYDLICNGTTTPMCFCEIDGATQTVMPRISICNSSTAAAAFQTCVNPG